MSVDEVKTLELSETLSERQPWNLEAALLAQESRGQAAWSLISRAPALGYT